jgi:ParB family chromosome partitioning protein
MSEHFKPAQANALENVGQLKNVQRQAGTQDSNAVKVREIPIGDIRMKANVRTEYIDIEELAESIRLYGLLQPFTVYRDGEGYAVKTGHRRFLACQQLADKYPDRFTNIPCIISDEDNAAIVQLVENIQRTDLTGAEMSDALTKLKNQGLSHKQIAEFLGKQEGYVKNLFMGVNAVNKSEKLKEAISHAGMTLEDINATKQVPDEQQRLALLEQRKEGNITRKEMYQKAQELKDTGPSLSDDTAPVINGIEEPQKVALPIRLTISPATKEITISPESPEACSVFDRFVEDIRLTIEQSGKYTIVNEPVNTAET